MTDHFAPPSVVLDYEEQVKLIAAYLRGPGEELEDLARRLSDEATPEGVVRLVVDRIIVAVERARREEKEALMAACLEKVGRRLRAELAKIEAEARKDQRGAVMRVTREAP